MGRQSARLYFQGKDHKDIYFQGKYHKALYKGAELIWQKLKVTGNFEHFILPFTENIAAANYGNGILILMTVFGVIWVTTDFINYTKVDNFQSDSAVNFSGGIVFTGSHFIIRTVRYVTIGNGRYIRLATENGLDYTAATAIGMNEIGQTTLLHEVDNEFVIYSVKGSSGKTEAYYKTQNGTDAEKLIPSLSDYDGDSVPFRQAVLEPSAPPAFLNGYYYVYGALYTQSNSAAASYGYYRTKTFKEGEIETILTYSVLGDAWGGYKGAFGLRPGTFATRSGYPATYDGDNFIDSGLTSIIKEHVTFNEAIGKWGVLDWSGGAGSSNTFSIYDEYFTLVAREDAEGAGYVLSDRNTIIYVKVNSEDAHEITVYREE